MFLNQTNFKPYFSCSYLKLAITKRQVFSYFSLLILFSSCVPFKDIPLIQETAESSYEVKKPNVEYNIKKGDLLNIDIKILEESTKDYLSGGAAAIPLGGGAGGGSGSPILFFTNYLVDDEGMIELPVVGKILAEGKTPYQVSVAIEDKLKNVQKFNEVTVKLSNFRVTLLGELSTPGVQYIYESHYNILHAISNAGGLTDFSNRKKVRLYRETEKGIKSVWLDLTNPNTIESEYFYLKPNDMIYIEPLKAKAIRSNVQTVTIGVSILSIITTVVALISR